MSGFTNHQTLRIDGAATIAQAADLRDRLAAATASCTHLEVDVAPDSADVTLIQLLAAARRSLEERGGTLRFAHAPSGAFGEALAGGGFCNTAEDGTFWNVEVNR